MAPLLSPKEGDKVLDIGSGTGGMAIHLAKVQKKEQIDVQSAVCIRRALGLRCRHPWPRRIGRRDQSGSKESSVDELGKRKGESLSTCSFSMQVIGCVCTFR